MASCPIDFVLLFTTKTPSTVINERFSAKCMGKVFAIEQYLLQPSISQLWFSFKLENSGKLFKIVFTLRIVEEK